LAKLIFYTKNAFCWTFLTFSETTLRERRGRSEKFAFRQITPRKQDKAAIPNHGTVFSALA
jgi:hypothetical protein